MTYRDDVLARKALRDAEVRKLGVNIDDIRKESRTSSAVGAMLSRIINESAPTQGHERIYADDFAGQTFNGTNNEYSLSKKVLGMNILVWRVEQSTGTLIPQVRTTNPAPSGEEFWFDRNQTIRVGIAPQSLDGLLAVYISSL